MKSREKAVLAALRLPSQPRVVVEESLDELGRLAESAGAMVAFTRASSPPYRPSTGARIEERRSLAGEVP